MIDLKEICFSVQQIVRETGEMVRNERKQFSKENDIETKGHSDFVTRIDKASERQLVEKLGDLIPSSGFIAEEGTSTKRGDVYNWVIDPIDGTTNFIHGLPPHAISVALMRGKEIVVGVVLEITGGELFYAWENSNAYCNGEVIHVSDAKTHSEALIATGFPYSDFTLLDQYLKALKFMMQNAQGVRRPGAASIDLCYVACGRFDAFWEYGLHPWDMAAAALIIKQAGGKICSIDNKDDDYLFNGKIIAANNAYFQEFSQIIKACMND